MASRLTLPIAQVDDQKHALNIDHKKFFVHTHASLNGCVLASHLASLDLAPYIPPFTPLGTIDLSHMHYDVPFAHAGFLWSSFN